MATLHGLDSGLIKSLHFYDLQSILFAKIADEMRQAIKMHNEKRMQAKGIDTIKYVTGKEILKYL